MDEDCEFQYFLNDYSNTETCHETLPKTALI